MSSTFLKYCPYLKVGTNPMQYSVLDIKHVLVVAPSLARSLNQWLQLCGSSAKCSRAPLPPITSSSGFQGMNQKSHQIPNHLVQVDYGSYKFWYLGNICFLHINFQLENPCKASIKFGLCDTHQINRIQLSCASHLLISLCRDNMWPGKVPGLAPCDFSFIAT